MIVNVRIRDGRTTFQFASCGDFRQVLGQEPGDDGRDTMAWARWNLDDPEWVPVRLHYLGKGSVSFVVAAEDEATSDDDLPAKEVAEARKRKWDERQEVAA